MRTHTTLDTALRELEGRGYPGYKSVAGAWAFPDFTLHVDHVQADPFAAPTRLRIGLTPRQAGLPAESLSNAHRRTAAASFLARSMARAARVVPPGRGSGRSGEFIVESPGQEVVAQTAVQVASDGSVDARLGLGLPAQGRRILGREAATLMVEVLPSLVRSALVAADASALTHACEVHEDAHHLRGSLAENGWIAFVADGSVLPRRSGVDDRPLEGHDVVPFASPPSLYREVVLPNRGVVAGMTIPVGVTLIVGGGFHGKSTLLRALQAGVVNHRPGDGRELVVTRADAVKIRAEDGRAVAGVDVSPFIDGLPLGQDTHRFTTANASGSTSQAAAMMEALEAGSRTLLMDEDTCATNFMIRDRRMQALVPKEGEPITPLVDRIRGLHRDTDVSSVLVLGGSGDYLDVADTVLAFRDYAVFDVTAEARRVAASAPTGRRSEATADFGLPAQRRPAPGCLNPSRGRRSVSVKVPDTRTLLFGEDVLDLGAVEQILGRGQLRALGAALVVVAQGLADGRRSVSQILDAVEDLLAQDGLDALDDRRPGDLTAFRRQELAAVLNRARSLRVV